jgi:hypothetical protein
MQELLNRLERAWAPTSPTVFPCETSSGPQQVSMPGERELWQKHDFLDFQPLLNMRATLGDAPLTALLLWQLAKQPEFAGTRFALAIDVPAKDGAERAVDLVSIRPADFGDRCADYCKAFQAIVEDARQRRSATWKAMHQIAQLPAGLAREMVRTHPELSAETFGTVGVSILRDAKVFLAPMSDLAFDGGFLAIGNVALPTKDARRVACVSVKGTAEQANTYLAVLRRVLEAGETAPSGFRFVQMLGGRGCSAEVAVKVSRQDDNSGVVENIGADVNRDAGEVNMQTGTSWVVAAIDGASEALDYAHRSGKLKDYYLVEIVKVVGKHMDTTDDAVKCAAALATWQHILPGNGELTAVFDAAANQWKIQYPAVAAADA